MTGVANVDVWMMLSGVGCQADIAYELDCRAECRRPKIGDDGTTDHPPFREGISFREY